ncbi:MAG: FAD-dependent oxidoreductase [Halobacteria archaeon]
MSETVIVGDGPTGLSAALLLAKNGEDAVVYGKDETKMHSAYLYNYLGIEAMDGTEFMEVARDQCDNYDVEVREQEVTSVDEDGDGFHVSTDEGNEQEADYLVLATGFARDLAQDLGLEFDGDAVDADKTGSTSKDGVYAGGWTTRPDKIQAAISVGDGAAIALEILSEEKGESFHDFDVP